MQQNSDVYLRETLERMPTRQLDDLLNRELTSPEPSGPNVRLILKVLREREKEQHRPTGPKEKAAWEKYQRYSQDPEPQPEQESRGKWVLRVASVALALLVLLTVLPQQAAAQSFFERLVSWTDSVFALLSPGDTGAGEYVFRTSNPGLQQVYDAVVELGVTQPVVPMWLPEGYELTECRVMDNPSKKRMVAVFSDGSGEAVVTIDIYSKNITHEYSKDNVAAQQVEFSGITHNVTNNNEMLLAVWTKENLECSIYIDCQEEILNRILRSIYTMEDE